MTGNSFLWSSPARKRTRGGGAAAAAAAAGYGSNRHYHYDSESSTDSVDRSSSSGMAVLRQWLAFMAVLLLVVTVFHSVLDHRHRHLQHVQHWNHRNPREMHELEHNPQYHQHYNHQHQQQPQQKHHLDDAGDHPSQPQKTANDLSTRQDSTTTTTTAATKEQDGLVHQALLLDARGHSPPHLLLQPQDETLAMLCGGDDNNKSEQQQSILSWTTTSRRQNDIESDSEEVNHTAVDLTTSATSKRSFPTVLVASYPGTSTTGLLSHVLRLLTGKSKNNNNNEHIEDVSALVDCLSRDDDSDPFASCETHWPATKHHGEHPFRTLETFEHPIVLWLDHPAALFRFYFDQQQQLNNNNNNNNPSKTPEEIETLWNKWKELALKEELKQWSAFVSYWAGRPYLVPLSVSDLTGFSNEYSSNRQQHRQASTILQPLIQALLGHGQDDDKEPTLEEESSKKTIVNKDSTRELDRVVSSAAMYVGYCLRRQHQQLQEQQQPAQASPSPPPQLSEDGNATTITSIYVQHLDRYYSLDEQEWIARTIHRLKQDLNQVGKQMDIRHLLRSRTLAAAASTATTTGATALHKVHLHDYTHLITEILSQFEQQMLEHHDPQQQQQR